MKFKILTLLLVVACGLAAQRVHIEFSNFPNHNASLCLKRGLACDTVWKGTLDATGKVVVELQGKVEGYLGMADLTIDAPNKVNVDFVLSDKENVQIYSSEKSPNAGSIIFSNSPENKFLKTHFMAQAVRQHKIMLLAEAQRLYDKESPFYATLGAQINLLGAELQSLDTELLSSKLYAAKFIEFYNFNQKLAKLPMLSLEEIASLRKFLCDSLDIDNLFTSGFWYPIINSSLVLYANDAPYHKDFINDMAKILNRATSEIVFNTLADNVFTICETMGWNEEVVELSYFLMNSGRLKNVQGNLKTLMSLYKVSKGNKAINLSQGAIPMKKTILVFYETGCGACEFEMEQLIANYSLLKEKGYDLVSVSADKDINTFSNLAATFPWQAKFCDLKGFDGPDFKNYGVIGTPTFYIIEDGIIQGRYAQLAKTGLLN